MYASISDWELIKDAEFRRWLPAVFSGDRRGSLSSVGTGGGGGGELGGGGAISGAGNLI